MRDSRKLDEASILWIVECFFSSILINPKVVKRHTSAITLMGRVIDIWEVGIKRRIVPKLAPNLYTHPYLSEAIREMVPVRILKLYLDNLIAINVERKVMKKEIIRIIEYIFIAN